MPTERTGDSRSRLLATKLLAPRPPDRLVPRVRLQARLNESLASCLTLIQAPAGFGKTTAALSCLHVLEERGVAIAWLNADRLDTGPARFLRYMVEAIHRAAPDLVDDCEAAFEQGAPDLANTVCVDLVNTLAAGDRAVCIVIEDLHLVDNDDAMAALAFLIECSPLTLRFLITSRTRPKLPLPRWQVSGRLNLITADDLRLDEQETCVFLRDAWRLDLAVEDIRALWRATEGWPAALQLAALSLRGGAEVERQDTTLFGAEANLADYLTENVLDGLDLDHLDFLICTSILERLSGELCDAVCGRADSQAILEELVRQDLFIRPLDGQGDWFRYHHLIASQLRRRLRRDHRSWIRELHLSASAWFEQAGDIEAAVVHAKEAGEMERAIAIVEAQAMQLVVEGRLGSLIGLADLLPPAKVRTRPALLRGVAWAFCLTRRMDRAQLALRDLLAALDLTPDLPDAELMRAEARVIQAAYDAYRDRTNELEASLLPFVADPGRFNARIVAAASNTIAFAMLVEGRYEAAVDTLERNFVFHDAVPGTFPKLYGLCYVGLAERGRGRVAASRAALEHALHLAVTEAGARSFGARMVSGVLALVAYETGDLDRAAELIDEHRKLGIDGGIIDFSIAAYVAANRIAFGRGDAEAAAAIVEEGLQVAARLSNERLRAAMVAEKLRLCLAQRDTEAAEAALAGYAAPERGDPAGRWIADMLDLAKARLLAARGDTEQALVILRHRLDHAGDEEQSFLAFRLRLQIATTCAMAGDPAAASEPLIAAVSFAAAQGLIRDFIDEGPAMRILLERLARRLPVSRDNARLHRHLWDVLCRWPGAGKPVGSGVAASLLALTEPGTAEPIVDRELEILEILARGRSNKVIARELGLNVNTIKWHLKNLYRKLGADGRAQAVLKAKARGLLSPAD